MLGHSSSAKLPMTDFQAFLTDLAPILIRFDNCHGGPGTSHHYLNEMQKLETSTMDPVTEQKYIQQFSLLERRFDAMESDQVKMQDELYLV